MRLKKESRVEVERLAREDPEWWPGVLEHIAGGGRLEEVVSERAWSWGALWGWIQADEGRVEEYEGALKARAQWLAFEAGDEVDRAVMEDVPLRKFRAETKLKLAGKMDRGRWGESSEVKHSGSVGLNLMAVLSSLPRSGQEKLVEEVPVARLPSKAPVEVSGVVDEI